MPRVLSRLPVSLHGFAAAVLALVAMGCVMAALICFLAYSQTTETTGHLWWKETRTIPLAERRPYMLVGSGLIVAALCCAAGVLELITAAARRTDVRLGSYHDTSLPFVLIRAAGRSWRRFHGRRAAQLAALEARRAAAQEAAAQRRYERSTAGRAARAYQRGDEFFSIELEADGDLAQHLNDIYTAGWRQESVSRSHRTTRRSEARGDGGHDVTRQSTEIRTYVFRRVPSARRTQQ